MNEPKIIPRHRKGDYWNGMLLTLTDDNNVPVNLSNYTCKADFKETANTIAALKFDSADGTILLNSIGQIRFIGRIIDCKVANYLMDVQLTPSNGCTETIADYKWEIHQDITN